MQRRHVRSASTRSGARSERHCVGAVSSKEIVQTRRFLKKPLVVERSAKINGLSQHDRKTHECEKGSQSALEADSIRWPASSSLSLRHVNIPPAFCLPHYRWSPLHTSCAQTVVEEHEAVIQWYEQNLRPSDVNVDDEVAVAWLTTARSRCDALCTFAQGHRTLYGLLDANKLQEMEACLLRLLLCVKRAEQHWNLISTRSSVGTSLNTTRTACQQTGAREKHISFARPLVHFFSSVVLPEEEEPAGGSLVGATFPVLPEESTEARGENVDDAPYTGRTSGVYYGNLSSGLGAVNTISTQRPIRDEEKNELSWPQPRQRLSGLVAAEDAVESVLSPVSSSYRLFSTPFVLGSGVWLRKERRVCQNFWLYIFLTTTCCVLSLLAVVLARAMLI
ncbi:hypothetical protein TraAM80_01009 [Trypanosoma rangeli]|uniref:Transmembrane protein n=1 Tax=Trypanosoma rangeli TaxID=5698 RepID=A0A422P0X3_TRYRA|nr:uncharacterized protein TraAM80_01009 [Trypanosoma rangeli]RNF11392.1 hypothetical protein TraAM80_01009 [Trypanosoma rangeli]|eukprot:RNF11392.1 hypothetical protein TraAM80_01009 [Trypanosoma rangeli]